MMQLLYAQCMSTAENEWAVYTAVIPPCIHGQVHDAAVYTVVYTGRVHGRLRAVYTSTRAVYTASYTASTRPSTHIAVYTARVHNLHGAGLSCVHGPCL